MDKTPKVFNFETDTPIYEDAKILPLDFEVSDDVLRAVKELAAIVVEYQIEKENQEINHLKEAA